MFCRPAGLTFTSEKFKKRTCSVAEHNGTQNCPSPGQDAFESDKSAEAKCESKQKKKLFDHLQVLCTQFRHVEGRILRLTNCEMSELEKQKMIRSFNGDILKTPNLADETEGSHQFKGVKRCQAFSRQGLESHRLFFENLIFDDTFYFVASNLKVAHASHFEMFEKGTTYLDMILAF